MDGEPAAGADLRRPHAKPFLSNFFSRSSFASPADTERLAAGRAKAEAVYGRGCGSSHNNGIGKGKRKTPGRPVLLDILVASSNIYDNSFMRRIVRERD